MSANWKMKLISKNGYIDRDFYSALDEGVVYKVENWLLTREDGKEINWKSNNGRLIYSESFEDFISDNIFTWELITDETEETKQDTINPSHYKNGDIECIDAIKSATIGKVGIEAVCVANVIKYLWRYEDKNGIEDVKKSRWYLERLLKELEGKGDK